MECPYCHAKMQEGTISGDGRSGVIWTAEEKKSNVWDKLDRLIGGAGRIEAAKYSLANFAIEAYYCEHCHKMIFDTNIGK